MVTTIDIPSQSSRANPKADHAIGIWLLACCAMLFVMVLIGGLTRLTQSGLSITEWRPVTGIVPPLSATEWQSEFSLYQQIPEFQQLTPGMMIEQFKAIYWWEFIHRLWGRLIGVVFVAGFITLLLRGQIRRPLIPHLAAMPILIGLQGALGWFMVQSGLSVRTDVSQYRLAAHFLFAIAVYSYVLWIALTLLRPQPCGDPAARRLRPHLLTIAGVLIVTLTFGAFVAGLNGGLVYNSFPLMGGALVPGDAFQAAWSPFEDPVTAQFIHRWLAMTVVALAIFLWLRVRRLRLLPIDLLGGMVLLQAALGISTLLLVVPIPLAVAHQAGAVVLWTLALWGLHATR